jgi:FkbM family methyltransferase
MNFPGIKLLRHWFWILMFRYPRLRVGLTRALLPERDIDVRIFGAPLHINTREEIGLWRAAKIAEGNVIFRDEAASLLNLAFLVRPGDSFVDVGANVGLYSSVLARYAQLFPETNFIAIEANPGTAERLRRSVAGTAVRVINVGASDRAADLVFETGVTSGVFKVAQTTNGNRATKIPCQRLDALDVPPGDLVLKIDVEDHELPVLRGASGLLDAQRIKVIYLDGYKGEEIPDLLRRAGFELFDGRTLERCRDVAPGFSLLAIHQSRLASSHAS